MTHRSSSTDLTETVSINVGMKRHKHQLYRGI